MVGTPASQAFAKYLDQMVAPVFVCMNWDRLLLDGLRLKRVLISADELGSYRVPWYRRRDEFLLDGLPRGGDIALSVDEAVREDAPHYLRPKVCEYRARFGSGPVQVDMMAIEVPAVTPEKTTPAKQKAPDARAHTVFNGSSVSDRLSYLHTQLVAAKAERPPVKTPADTLTVGEAKALHVMTEAAAIRASLVAGARPSSTWQDRLTNFLIDRGLITLGPAGAFIRASAPASIADDRSEMLLEAQRVEAEAAKFLTTHRTKPGT